MKPALLVLPILLLSQAVCKPSLSTPPAPKLTLAQIVKEATQNEAKIQTGALFYKQTVLFSSIPPATRRTEKTRAQGLRQNTYPKPAETRRMWFDNQRRAFLLSTSDDRLVKENRSYFDPTIIKGCFIAKDPSNVPMCVIQKNTYRPGDTDCLLRGLFCQNMNPKQAKLLGVRYGKTLVQYSTPSGEIRQVEMDPRQNNAVCTVFSRYRQTEHPYSKIVVERRLQSNGIWYPTRITGTSYQSTESGKWEIVMETGIEIISATLNLPLTEKDLAFGPIPFGATVTDYRFVPPLKYNQGTHQFTDAQLKAFSKNRDALTRATAYTPEEFARLQKERHMTAP